MAHTVASLSKSLKKTPDEVIKILANSGVEGKQHDSEILPAERKILMAHLNKRTGKSNVSITNIKKPLSGQRAGGNEIKIQIRKKHSATSTKTIISTDTTRKTQQQKPRAITPPQPQTPTTAKDTKTPQSTPKSSAKPSAKPSQKTTDKTTKTDKITTPKPSAKPAKKGKKTDKKAKKSNKTDADKREQLHLAYKNSKRKLKKKERTLLSLKMQEERAQHAFVKPVERVIHEVKIPENIKISDLAQKMATKSSEVLKVLMSMGVMVTLNDVIDQDTAMLVVEEMGHKGIVSKEETVEDSLLLTNENIGKTSTRPPIVTIMGHVDHGKTSLLDYIRKAKITDNEVGGITQHIGAYQVNSNNHTITFIDTPGHAAFSKMRSRGANATDIVVLVVAADDGVMPQTIESIKHAKAADVPIIVAINKIDKEGATADKIKQALSTHEVNAEDWGGDVMMVPVSAHTGEGIDALLDAISLSAEILEFNAVADQLASGVVLEARLDKGRGKVTTVLVQSGTLKVGDILIAGLEYGKVKQIVNDRGQSLQTAGPSMPVEILGLSGVPDAGAPVLAVDSERKAREVANFRKTKDRETMMQKQQAVKMENFLSKMEEGSISAVNILIKSDVKGSEQALVEALTELSTKEIKVNIVSSGVGAINNTDISLASTTNAIVLGFNVRADAVARKTADTEGVRIEYYSIIYNLIDDIKNIMGGLLSPELSENIIGIAAVKDVFKSKKLGEIAGCIVEEGVVKIDSPIRILRDNVVIYEGELESLRRFKDNVKQVKSGTECGIGVKNYTDIKGGDQIEVFERIERARSL